MIFKFAIIAISLIAAVLIFDMLKSKLKLKYRLYKELKSKKQREKAFKKKMKKLSKISNSPPMFKNCRQKIN